MATKTKNPIWVSLTSVKLALFLLFALAITSIIGTIIPQGQPPGFYVDAYGPNLARLMQTLSIPEMYNSWWFMVLLAFFSLNLIVCSIERIPNAWRLVTMDNLATDPERLKKMGVRKAVQTEGSMGEAVEKTTSFLAKKGWKTSKREHEDSVMLFSQKGSWTRFGVYIVHSSILVILVGAIIGSPRVANTILRNPTFAFKGSVMLPETQQTDMIYSFSGIKIPLGFTVRCDYFDIEYYPNGMPKKFLSKLTVIEDGEEVLKKDIVVNEPLIHRGITFYQSSYQPYSDFVISLQNNGSGINKTSIVPARQQTSWEEAGVRYGIINTATRGQSVVRLKIWFTDDQADPSVFWLEPGREAVVKRPTGDYTLSAKQLYATGLQVAKDPGVWWVYIGCGLMLIGLLIAFFMSHRKIWALIYEEDGKTTVLFAGNAHKNKVGFERSFTSLVEDFK
ncbi:MAG: cytochrome c biogenesis protein ResB [Desulfobulbaceae bacterium]|nr:cytochrome c biogenesis protein ResB [Desulfobulbaceae bacterium]